MPDDTAKITDPTQTHTSVGMERHWRREHFVPIRKTDLIKRLADRLDNQDRKSFLALCRLISLLYRIEFQQLQENLKDYYSAVSPDVDLHLPDKNAAAAQRESKVDRLFRSFEQLLSHANFVRLSPSEVQEAVGAASEWGVRLHLDLSLFDRVDVYARGDIVDRREHVRFYFFRRDVDVPIYRRVAVIFRLKNRSAADDENNPVYLRLLKNVPKQDLDMLLPGGEVQMSLWDRGKILLPTVSGIVIAVVKIFKGVLLLAMAGIYGLIVFLGFLFGTLGYGARSFFGYQQIKAAYELNLTKSLYYQNMDTNAGVIHRLIDEAQEQEVREAILAYFALWQEADPGGTGTRDLDVRCERQLMELTNIDVDFQVDDALRKLADLGLATSDGDDHWQAVGIQQAIEEVDKRLRGLLR